jgi:serine/threonine protein kinase
MILREGDRIRDTYEVEREIGRGAFAEVYRVNHKFLGRQAMKVFTTPGLTPERVNEALQEAALLSKMGHPNIIRVFDANTFETADGVFGYFTMEYIAGGTLERFWQSHGRSFVPLDTTIQIILQACRGLAVAHAETPPIVHRDVKPQNILVGYGVDGIQVRLSDFGLAKSVNPLTMLASTKGTLLFKAPEAVKDATRDSPAGDVWALGMVAYLLLADVLPFLPVEGEPPFSAMRFQRRPIEPSSLNYNVPPSFDSLIAKMLVPDPKVRFKDAREVLEAVEDWNETRVDSVDADECTGEVDRAKSALGAHATPSETAARAKAEEARELARQAKTLGQAADLLEEAINECPALGTEYGDQLRLWRKGVLM